ncbi:hypothetical protein LCGC14_1430550 [marine sediment metagenome]|uniref:dUTP diphosphatase n=1 Tax=marine sediment metagenome TaxID=412755 RepID=A0A0F9K9W6_9ZZZZ
MKLKEIQQKQNDIGLLQMYMQLYDRKVLSKETLLKNFGFNLEGEKKKVEKESCCCEVPIIKWKKLDPKAIIPKYATEGAAAFDFHALIDKDLTLEPGKRIIILTGLAVEIPVGWELLVSPRSGHSFNHGITILNSPGIIDSDFRMECKVVLHNTSSEPFSIKNKDRIAQARINKSTQVKMEVVEELSKTNRGEGCCNSTGR